MYQVNMKQKGAEVALPVSDQADTKARPVGSTEEEDFIIIRASTQQEDKTPEINMHLIELAGLKGEMVKTTIMLRDFNTPCPWPTQEDKDTPERIYICLPYQHRLCYFFSMYMEHIQGLRESLNKLQSNKLG